MIGNGKYYLGGYIYWESGTGILQVPEEMYLSERKISGSTYYDGSNPNSWVGKIALMYASDYGYATENCKNNILHGENEFVDSDLSACKTTNWLFNNSAEWLLPQYMNKQTYVIDSYGSVTPASVTDFTYNGVRPVLYLTSSVKITGGNGTSSSPYTLE